MIQHIFVPAPFYPNRCDVKVDDAGRPRTCGRPRAEHEEEPKAQRKPRRRRA
jgi:hypothetical protein